MALGLRAGSAYVRRVPLLLCVGCFAIAPLVCGRSVTSREALSSALADIHKRATYGLSVDVIALSGGPTDVAGHYGIEVQAPDHTRTVFSRNGSEINRTIAVGRDLFGSGDQGKTWTRRPPSPGSAEEAFSPIVEELDNACSVSGSNGRLKVLARTLAGDCEKPLKIDVTIVDNRLDSFETEFPVDSSTIKVQGKFDLQQRFGPITAPSA
jgi:hypothetical protein